MVPRIAAFPGLVLPASETAGLLASTDWTATALGPIERWPQSLRIAVGICLNSRFPMFVWWGPQLINIYNDAYIPVLGKRHPAAFGRPARPFWEEIWPVLGPQAEAVMQRGEATWNERELLVMERHGYAEDTWFTWSYSPIPDERGGIGGLFCACTEDTARVRVERERDGLLAEVELERRRLEEAFRQSPAFLAVLRGPQHVFHFANERYLQLIGWRDVVGRPAREVLPEVEGQGFFEILDEVYTSGTPYVGRAMRLLVRRDPDRPLEEAVLDFVYQPMRGADGATNAILVHGIDVTERKQYEQRLQAARAEAERASRMKDEFLATLSHELRTPLNAILGWAGLLKLSAALPADLAKGVEVIERNARAQGHIIEDLLDMSAIISGKVRLDRRRVELAGVLRAALASAAPAAEARQVRLQSRIEPPGEAVVSGDANRLQQVLWNLLTNAIKFTPPGGRVEASLDSAPAEFVLRVADTGEGIEPEFLPFIFDRFRQADPSKTRRVGGLGLGLSIVKQLVELHGGTVQAESAGRGRGAAFTVRLPRSAAPAASPSDAAPGGDIAGLRVLVVDDDADAREVVHQLLQQCRAAVSTAASAGEAVRKLEQQRFDVLVSDIGMPGEDGNQLLRRVRGLGEARGGNIPAIALSAYARSEDRVQAMHAGFQTHLAKPVEPAELIATIASVARRA